MSLLWHHRAYNCIEVKTLELWDHHMWGGTMQKRFSGSNSMFQWVNAAFILAVQFQKNNNSEIFPDILF